MTVKIFRSTSGGLRQMLLISSNSFRDREGDFVTQKGLETYAANYPGDNVVLVWHGGDPIGVIKAAEMWGAFLVEVAEELPNRVINLAKANEPPIWTTVKEVWDAIDRSADDITWGASIGFATPKEDEQDKTFRTVLKYETSVLPLETAANAITFSQILRGKNQHD